MLLEGEISSCLRDLLSQNRKLFEAFHYSLIRAQVLADEKQPHGTRLPPPCFFLGMVFFG